ncbi:MAG: WD40 repeat domain-containing serine/threonine protein kinase [Planctomycetota bacterium]|jgi:WD40 repeat protein
MRDDDRRAATSGEGDDEPARTRLRELSADRYVDFLPAGEGGMGIVYRATDTDLNREVAFKVIRPDGGDGTASTPAALTPPKEGTPDYDAFETLKKRFLQEAWVTGGMAHPGIVPVYELGQTQEGVPYYTMRFIKGKRTLATAIEEAKTIEERLALLDPFLRTCDAISYAHSHGVIHRDLKPSNIALGEFGEVLLIDWGMAKVADHPDVAADKWYERVREFREAEDLRTVATAMGTPGYMSPEAASGRMDDVDARSDIYSLGAVLFKTLTGRLPFEYENYLELLMKLREQEAPSAAEVNPAVPDALADICAKALARDKEDRFADAGQMAQALRSWQQESARRKEVRALMREADTALEGAEGLEGEALLRQLDRVTALCGRVLEHRPRHRRTRRLLESVEATRRQALQDREREIRHREREARRNLVRNGAGVALVVVAIGVFIASWMLDVERRDVTQARREADAERERASVAERGRENAEAMTRVEREAKNEALALARTEHDERVAAEAARDTERDARAQAEEEAASSRTAREQAEALAASARQTRDDAVQRMEAAEEERERAVTRMRAERWAKRQALRKHRAAELAAASRQAQGWDPMLALMLAREAVQVLPTPTAVAQLREAHGEAGAHVFRLPDAAIRSATFSPDGTRILTTSEDNAARVWDLGGREVAVLEGHEMWVNGAAFSPDGTRIVTASSDDTARLWQANGDELAVLAGHQGTVTSAVFSPDGTRILTACRDKTARLWDLDGKQLAVLGGNPEWVTSATFSSDGKYILTVASYARLWNGDGQPLQDLRRPGHEVLDAAFSRDGTRIVTASVDRTARLWGLGQEPVIVLRGHGDVVHSAVFSPDGRWVVTACRDGAAYLWDVAEGSNQRLRGHLAAVTSAVFSPDGQTILTASADGTARLWNLEGREVGVLRGHYEAVTSALFSDDGKHILTVSDDGAARAWHARTEDLVRLARERVTRDFTPQERARYEDLLAPIDLPPGDGPR